MTIVYQHPAEPHRWPVTLTCDDGHDPITWIGTWHSGDEATCLPACWFCGGPARTTAPRYPYVPF